MDYMLTHECSTYQELSQKYYQDAQICRYAIDENYNNEIFLKKYEDAMRKGSWCSSKARRLLGAAPFDSFGNSQFNETTLWEGR